MFQILSIFSLITLSVGGKCDSFGALNCEWCYYSPRVFPLPHTGLPQKVHALVEDAVAKGAKLLTGGKLPGKGSVGQFYPPTVLLGVKRGMKIWEEEVFGPVSKGCGVYL